MRRPGAYVNRRGNVRGLSGRSALPGIPPDDLLFEFDARYGVVTGATMTWTDQGPSAYVATQGDGARQPSVVSNPTLGQTLRTANPDFMSLDASGLSAPSGPLSIYCVGDVTITGAIGVWLDFAVGRISPGFNASVMTYFDGTALRNGTDVIASGPDHFTYIRNGTSLDLYHGGVADSGGTLTCTGDTPIGGLMKLFSSQNATQSFLAADVALVAIYTAAHDAAQRQAVWDYINREWSV